MPSSKFRLNGDAKLLGLVIPIGAMILLIGSRLFSTGQDVQKNTDNMRRMNQRICAIERVLPHPILDADCDR